MTSERQSTIVLGALGILGFLALWEVLGQTRALGLTWPAFSQVVTTLIDPGRRGLFERATLATLTSVAIGYASGVIFGCLFAGLCHVVKPLKRGGDRSSAMINAIPSIALAPILLLLVGPHAGPVVLAAINVFFVMYIATSSGFVAVSPVLSSVFTVFGASPLKRTLLLDVPSAFPSIVSGLKLAMPAAIIGTVIGEWFGAPRGLGIIITNAMQNFQIPLMWAAVVIACTVSLTLFLLLTAYERHVYATYK